MASLLLSRCCQASVLRLPVIRQIPRKKFTFRNFSEENGREFKTRTTRRSIRERAMAPAGEGAYSLGKGALAVGGCVGLGALCFYGLGLANEAGAIDRSMLWPQHVKERIRSTYMYFGSTIVITAISCVQAFKSPFIMNIAMKNGWTGLAISMAAIMGTGILAQSIEYRPGFGPKQMAWVLHAAVMGAMLAPMCFLGGPILARAAWYTAGLVGGLSAIAVCAPSEKFLMMGGPLAMGLGVVIVSSLGTMFFPASTALGAGLHSVSLYGGLLLFSGFLLFDTQRIIAKAERYPTWGVAPFDPVNAALSIYMDTLNIFIRIATILASGNGNQRRK